MILGDKPLAYYLASFFFSFFSMLAAAGVGSMKRNPQSGRTPAHFDLSFLIYDNLKKFFITGWLLFIGYRFLPEFSMLSAVGLGVCASFGVVFFFNKLAEMLPGFKKFIQVAQEMEQQQQQNQQQ